MNSVEERDQALGQAAEIVSACRRCEIGSIRRNAVYGSGTAAARIMIIGEGPGETEDKIGQPFIGRAGELLTKMLAAIDITRDQVYIANTVKCRPSIEEGGRRKNRPPTLDEMKNCRPYLDEQITLVQPDVILCLGAPAAKSFLGKNFSITKQRGQWFPGPHDIPLIVTFHPAYVLRLTGGTLSEVKRLVWSDLKALRDHLNGAEHRGAIPRETAAIGDAAIPGSQPEPSADAMDEHTQAVGAGHDAEHVAEATQASLF